MKCKQDTQIGHFLSEKKKGHLHSVLFAYILFPPAAFPNFHLS